jgi:hypothetical protein
MIVATINFLLYLFIKDSEYLIETEDILSEEQLLI